MPQQFSLSFHEDDSFSIDHDNRVHSSKNVDPSKTKDNIVYEGNIPLPELYDKTFQKSYEEFIQRQIATGHADRVKDYPPTYYEFVIKKQQEGEKRLQEAKTKLAHKKDLRGKQSFTKAAKQIIVQIGNIDDFAQMDQAAQTELSDRMAQALNEYMRTFQQENPTLVICNAVIHRDEMSASPHLHLTYVPVAESSRGQRIVNSQTKAINALGFFADKQKRPDGEFETEQTKWQTKERDRIISIAQRFGLTVGYTRGNRGKGQTIDEYRATMDAVRQSQARLTDAQALAVEADAKEKLSVHNDTTIAEQESILAKNVERLEQQKAIVAKNREQHFALQEDIKKAEVEYKRKQDAVIGADDAIKKLTATIDECEQEVAKTLIRDMPGNKEHEKRELSNGFGKGKSEYYIIPPAEYEAVNRMSGLQSGYYTKAVKEAFKKIKEAILAIPLVRDLIETIDELRRQLSQKDRENQTLRRQKEKAEREAKIAERTLQKANLKPKELERLRNLAIKEIDGQNKTESPLQTFINRDNGEER